jgi:hypothetical protein
LRCGAFVWFHRLLVWWDCYGIPSWLTGVLIDLMTLAADELQQRRFLARWWWLDPARAKEKCEAALAWETVRRTSFYPALWRTFSAKALPIITGGGKPSLAGALRRMHMIQAARGVAGHPYFDFLMSSFNPELTWLELDEAQRLKAQGFVLGATEALKVNSDYLLPRQKADSPAVGFAVVELDLDDAGNVVVPKQVTHGFPLSRVAPLDFFRRLALLPGRYVAVIFDTRGARDALLEAFDRELQRWVGNWREGMKGSGRFAILWNGEDHTAVEYWAPQVDLAGFRAKRDEVALIPSDDPGSAILLVSAKHDPAAVRASFHTHLKTGVFQKWHSRCVEYWKTLKIESSEVVRNPDGTIPADEKGLPVRRPVLRYLFNPGRDLPPKRKGVRSARRADLWFGLAANDVVGGGIALGKTSAEGVFLYARCESYAAMRNHQRSAAARLQELEEAAGPLQEALERQCQTNSTLAKMGYFEAAAGSNEPSAGS